MVGTFVFFLIKDENKFDFKKVASENWIEPPKRERKRKYIGYFGILLNFCIICLLSLFDLYFSFPLISYSESEYFKQTMRQGGPAKPKEPRIPRMPQL